MNLKIDLDNEAEIIGNGKEGIDFVKSLMSNANEFNSFQKTLHELSISLDYQGYRKDIVNKYNKLSVYKDFTFDVKVGDLFLSDYEYSQTYLQSFFSLFGRKRANIKLSLYKVKNVYMSHYPNGFTKYQIEVDVEYIRKLKLIEYFDYGYKFINKK